MEARTIGERSYIGSWVLAGALLGLVAGIAFAMFEMVAAWLMGDGFWMPLRMIAAILVGEEALEPTYAVATAAIVGAGLHLVLSALYGAVLGGIAAVAPGVRSRLGVTVLARIYGLGLWLVNFYLIAPAAFEWFQDANPVVQFVAHAFVYGTLLGVLLAAGRARELSEPHRVPQRI